MSLQPTLLTFASVVCLCPTTFGVEKGPSDVRVVRVEVGSDAILPCSSGNQDLNSDRFQWKKEDPNGPKRAYGYVHGKYSGNDLNDQDQQFKGRVSHFGDELQHGNASIKIHNTKVEDSGIYICYFPNLHSQRFYVELVVDTAPPSSIVQRPNATTDGSLLQCDVRSASSKPMAQWQNSDEKVHRSKGPLVTESECWYNDSLLSTVNETEHYRCVAKREGSGHLIGFKIDVYTDGGKEQASETPGPGWLINGSVGFVIGVLTTVAAQKIFAVVKRRHFKYLKSKPGNPVSDVELESSLTTGSAPEV